MVRHTTLVAGLSLLASPTLAQVVYDNGLPDAVSGNEMTAWIQAEDFILGGPATIGAVRFWAFEMAADAYLGSIYYFFLNDAGGTPGTVIDEGLVTPTRVFDHATSFGDSYRYDFDIAPLAFGPGVFWLALHNGPLGMTGRREMYWETTASNATVRGMEDGAPFDGTWFSNSNEHAFVLYGPQQVVPEPATLLLLGSGLLGLAGVAHRRRRESVIVA